MGEERSVRCARLRPARSLEPPRRPTLWPSASSTLRPASATPPLEDPTETWPATPARELVRDRTRRPPEERPSGATLDSLPSASPEEPDAAVETTAVETTAAETTAAETTVAASTEASLTKAPTNPPARVASESSAATSTFLIVGLVIGAAVAAGVAAVVFGAVVSNSAASASAPLTQSLMSGANVSPLYSATTSGGSNALF